MIGAFIERQPLASYQIDDSRLERKYGVDITNKRLCFRPGVLQVGLDDSSPQLQAKLDQEHEQ